jgi:hypothetical protein
MRWFGIYWLKKSWLSWIFTQVCLQKITLKSWNHRTNKWIKHWPRSLLVDDTLAKRPTSRLFSLSLHWIKYRVRGRRVLCCLVRTAASSAEKSLIIHFFHLFDRNWFSLEMLRKSKTLKVTNHDGKQGVFQWPESLGLDAFKEFIHFGLTSREYHTIQQLLMLVNSHEEILPGHRGRWRSVFICLQDCADISHVGKPWTACIPTVCSKETMYCSSSKVRRNCLE